MAAGNKRDRSARARCPGGLPARPSRSVRRSQGGGTTAARTLTAIGGHGVGAHFREADGWDMKAFVTASRALQGLPPVVQDAVVIDRVAAAFMAVDCAPRRSSQANEEAAGAARRTVA